MGEPARKLRDIEPDIRPEFQVIRGSGETTPGSADLKALESNPEKSNNTESIREQEAQGSNVIQGPWTNNVKGMTSLTKASGRFAFLKKSSPIVAIGITLSVIIIGLFSMIAPLLPVHFKEVLVGKFNTQLTSMDVRNTKMLTKKMGTLKGICGSKITIKCKYSTMSKRQVEKFKKAGIDVAFDPNDSKTLFGRVKPKGFTFEEKTILPTGFMNEIGENANFRLAVKKAYNPLYAGFSDSIWSKVASRLKISKAPITLEGDDYDSKMDNLETDLQDANKLERQSALTPDDIDPSTGEAFSEGTDEALDQANETIEVMNEMIEDAGGDGSVTSKLMNGTEKITNAVKITGMADDLCTVYRTFRAIGFAAKTVRVAQLASYAMIFLNLADQIKAGEANQDDVEFVGKILTNTSEDEFGNLKSATDSFGYRYAAYGDLGGMPTSAMQYMAAAGLSGMMVNFFESFPKGTKTTCKLLGNPLVGFASFAGGVALMVGSGGTSVGATLIKTFSKKAIKEMALAAAKSPGFWLGTGLAFAEIFLPGLLKDIIAGKVIDKTTIGANAGDAITSGASGIMGTSAKLGGNAPLTPDQAVAYSTLTNKIAAQYSEEEQTSHNQFDITNKNTFLGKFARLLIPNVSKLSSVSSSITSITTLPINSLASLTPIAKASTTDEYTRCTDMEYRDLNIATDPFCNVIYGIPAENLDIDPDVIVDSLVSSGDIYESDGSDYKAGDIVPDSKYDNFVRNCIDRTDPLGYDNKSSDGKECLFDANSKNKYYYLYYIDKRVHDGMDDEEVEVATLSEAASDGAADPGDSSQPSNTVKSGKGWNLKSNVDYSNTPCASGSTDKGTYKHPTEGFIIRKCKTAVGEVASIISQRTINMIAAAKKEGVTLTGSGFRSYEQQETLRRRNCSRGTCSPPTAKPGNSMHERGLAVDFNSASKTGPVFKWLSSHGAEYGYYNLPSESWHWSMNGH